MTTQPFNDVKALDSNQIVAVIGAGAMGAGIAQVAAQAGHKVLLFDKNEHALFKAKEGISTQLNKRVLKGKLEQKDVDACLENIIPTYSLHDLAVCDLVIEAIVERLEVKQDLFLELEGICKDSCLFTTNTSSISITSIASKLTKPARFFGLHFFNPAPVMALVEVISGLASDAFFAQALYKTCKQWGKKPVFAKSNPGFIVNRVARPFYAEAMRVYEEQASSIEQIDILMRESGQFKMGPFELMDLIGHDVNYAVTQSVFNAYFQDPRFKPSLAQKSLVEAGFLGRKTGRGFYHYDDNGKKCSPESMAHENRLEPHTQAISECDNSLEKNDIIKRLDAIGSKQLRSNLKSNEIKHQDNQNSPIAVLIERFREANFYIDTEQVGKQFTIERFKFGTANIALTDGRSATERSVAEQLDNLILFDIAFDYKKVTMLAISASDNCSTEAIEEVQTLFSLIDIELIKLDDIAGLIVMRTLAMLTNEAADTCMQGVASAQDIDIAMCAGVNYPEGPLSWGQRVGVKYLHKVLVNLQANYGEDRYRPSALLRRKQFTNTDFY